MKIATFHTDENKQLIRKNKNYANVQDFYASQFSLKLLHITRK